MGSRLLKEGLSYLKRTCSSPKWIDRLEHLFVFKRLEVGEFVKLRGLKNDAHEFKVILNSMKHLQTKKFAIMAVTLR